MAATILERDDQIRHRREHPCRPIDFGDDERARYRGCNVVERCFNKLKQWPGIATRSDDTAREYHAGRCLAATALHWVTAVFGNTSSVVRMRIVLHAEAMRTICEAQRAYAADGRNGSVLGPGSQSESRIVRGKSGAICNDVRLSEERATGCQHDRCQVLRCKSTQVGQLGMSELVLKLL